MANTLGSKLNLVLKCEVNMEWLFDCAFFNFWEKYFFHTHNRLLIMA